MMDKPDVDAAYALKDADAVTRLYREWAETYDDDFASAQGYQMPGTVAEAFAVAGGQGPVLDVGAGTGIVGHALNALGVGPVDGVDLSSEMLAVARDKGCYRHLAEADITQPLGGLGPYKGIVSAGTFTLGHVGPEGIARLIEVAAPGCLCVIGVNAAHFTSSGFDALLADLANQIIGMHMQDVRIYDDRADPTHRHDMARLLTFRVR